MNKTNICTIEEWRVNWNELGNILLCSHEYMHQSLTIITVYGVVQRQIKFYSDRFPDDIQLKRIQYALFKNVHFLQECCATFCSVMQVSNSIESCEHLLPSSYLEYYNAFFYCFKNTINSTYFAYMLAKTIAEICMNNKIHTTVIDFLNDKPITFNDPLTAPDYCFKTLLNELLSETLEIIIDYCNSQNTDAYSDTNNDNYWKNHNFYQIDKLNDLVFNSCYTYFTQKMSNIKLIPLETIRTNAYSWLNLLNDTLQSKYGNIGLIIDTNPIHKYTLPSNLLLDLECIDTTIIYNKPSFRSSKVLSPNNRFGVNFKPFHQKLHMHTYLCENRFFDNERNWYQFNSDGTNYDDLYFHFKDLQNIISPNPLFVIGLTSNNQSNDNLSKEINTLYYSLKNLCKNSPNHLKNFNRYNVLFYMFGKFSLWLDYFVENPKNKFHVLVIDDKNTSSLEEKNFFAMLAIYSLELPGIFIKCFNAITFSKVFQIMQSLSKQGLITQDCTKEHTIIASKMKQAFDAIDCIWLEY